MREIAIKESNKEKINNAIKEAEGKASARTIDYDYVVRAIKEIEDKFWLIHKKDMEGMVVWVDIHAQQYPKAYKYTPDSTQFKVVKAKSGWKLLSVGRYMQDKYHSEKYEITEMPEITKQALIKAYTKF